MPIRRRLAKALALALLAAFGLALPAAAGDSFAPTTPPGLYDAPTATGVAADAAVVRVELRSPDDLEALAAELDVWAFYERKGPSGTAVAVARAAQIADLRSQGFQVFVDARETGFLHQPPQALEGQLAGIPGFPCYRTVEETHTDAAALAATFPGLATWVDIGDSWEKTQNAAAGFDIMMLQLTNSAIGGDKPVIYINSGIHAREYATVELALRFAEGLLADYGKDPDATWLLDYHQLHITLHGNPDGRKHAETGLSWRKNTNNNYCANTNTRGADLNRNCSFAWAASASTCSLTYPGSGAASEPETQALEGHAASIWPDQRAPDLTTPAPDDATGLFLDIHSFGQVVLTAWGFTGAAPPNGVQILRLGRKYGFFSGYNPQLGSTSTSVTDSTKDFTYGELGVVGYTIELGTSFFESCANFEGAILPDNLDGLRYMAKVARTPYMTPAGPDVVDPAVDVVLAAVGDSVTVTATLDDTRFFDPGQPAEPSQNITLGEAYLDFPPFLPFSEGPPPPIFNLAPSDGGFNSAVEAAEATIDTTGFSSGRHILYLQGTDAASNIGAVSALFFWLIDPATAPTLQGFVRDADTQQGIAAATVNVGDTFSTLTDGSGFYSFQIPAGTYDLEASADGYASAQVAAVTASDNQTVGQNFQLPAFEAQLANDVEGGVAGWTAQAPWGITSAQAHSPTRSWTDSPGGSYGNNANTSLTSPAVDFTGLENPTLGFWHRYDLEQGFDLGHVEVSTDGSTWTPVTAYSGTQTTFTQVQVPLPVGAGEANLQVRFRLTSDTSVTGDGWYVDDIELLGHGPVPTNDIFTDGFESGNTSLWTQTIGNSGP